MPKFKVEYTETRFYTVVVEAENEEDAREWGDHVASRDNMWEYRNEEYTVTRA